MPGAVDGIPAKESARSELSSTESGQTPLDQSFADQSHADWVQQTRRRAWQDTKFTAQARSYFLGRERYDRSEAEAWTLGGSVGLKTGYFRESFALGATAYTSQKLYGPADRDGTQLLKPGQRSYSVLGELYGEFLLGEQTRFSIGRLALDTPYLNRSDSRMTPQTYEAVTLVGVYGGEQGLPEWKLGAGYFGRMKPRNADDFASMSSVAGAAAGVDRGVYVLGGNYRNGAFSLGAINYFSDDIINIFYTEANIARPFRENTILRAGLQFSDQRSVGAEQLQGRRFSARQAGGKLELALGHALLTAAYSSAWGSADMQSPWNGYPGYASVQVEDFFRRGESAVMLRAAYEFVSVDGLSAHALWVHGSEPDDTSQHARDEYDLNLQWKPQQGAFSGLSVRLRYARVIQRDATRSTLEDLRLMAFYELPLQ
ncbi:outer membrane OprD family porin [Pseudoxanthomonas sp. 3HH-4]|uniref:OprD family outer membrane porin n=1 Tax=Pseudoxanthomonas sp. 3HH-4 TaxID=1690214 RepID=UPI00116D3924|nr:OprD family outer membrane porin [Pseudoxanthomonas sp. 3HH-4]TQM12103.1 outer membrane OprD family porin [Pseudoxanthomonas sp. 3HH-4]